MDLNDAVGGPQATDRVIHTAGTPNTHGGTKVRRLLASYGYVVFSAQCLGEGTHVAANGSVTRIPFIFMKIATLETMRYCYETEPPKRC